MVKINTHLIEQVIRKRKQNPFRYYVACKLEDQAGGGWVDVDTYVTTVSDKFNVKPKTVINWLYKLQADGWGTFSKKGPSRFYYASQDKLAKILEVSHYSRLSTHIGWDEITALCVARAFFYTATITGRAPEKTIARDTIHAITGHTRRTQRKYEKIAKVGKRANYAILERYRGKDHLLDTIYRTNKGIFVGVALDDHPLAGYLLRQLPNSYRSPLKVGRRRFNNPAIKSGAGNYEKPGRLYYEDWGQIRKPGIVGYVRDKSYKSLWYKVES